MAGLQFFDVTIPANGSRNIGAEGTYFRYDQGNAGGADESILVKADTGALATILKPGQSIRLPEKVRDWRISNYKNAAQITGIVTIGDGEIQDSQVAGTVSVVDGGKQRTMANAAFLGSVGAPIIASQYPHVQLWNPAGSYKNIIVEAITSTVTAANYLRLIDSAASIGALSSNGISKKLGGAASIAELRTLNQVSAMAGAALLGFNIGAGLSINFKLAEPIVIPPSRGLVCLGANISTDLTCNFEYFEEAI